MKKNQKITALSFFSLFSLALSSCTTTYDSRGRPVQSVDPGAAVVGAVAIGALGYALADSNNDDRRRHHRYHRPRRDHHRYHCY